MPNFAPPMPFSTSPQGQQEIEALRTRLMQSLQQQQQADQLKAMLLRPALPPGPGMVGDVRTPDFVPFGQQAQEAANQRQYGAFDQRMEDQDANFRAKVDAFNAANSVGAVGRGGARPDTQQMASGGLLGGVDYGGHDNRWSAGGSMAGYQPVPMGSATHRQQAAPQPVNPAALQQLQTIAPGLMDQVNENGALKLPNDPTAREAAIGKLTLAEQLRQDLSPAQQAQNPIPRGISSNPTTQERLAGRMSPDKLPLGVQERQAYLANRANDPRAQAYDQRQLAAAAKSQARRDQRSEILQGAQDGIDPSFLKMQQMLLAAGGGGGNAGGGNAVGGFNPAQLNIMMAMHPEAAGALAQGAMQMPAQMMAAQAQMGQLALQQQMVQQQADNTRIAGDAQHTDDHAGALQLVASRGGWNKMTPDEKRRAVLKSLKSRGGWITEAEKKGQFADLGTSTEEAIAALGGELPPYKPGWLPSSNEAEELRRGQLTGNDRLTNPGNARPMTRPPRQRGGLGA